MNIRFIKAPTPGVIAMLARRTVSGKNSYRSTPGAVGLAQGPLADMITGVDIAEKAANVQVEEIRGVCPQHFTMIAILGDTADVEAALKAIAQYFGKYD